MSSRRLVPLCLIAACSGGEIGPQDASTTDSGVDLRTVEVGTGQDMFVPLETGQQVVLTQGPQAGGGRYLGYHIFSAVRAAGFDPENALIDFTLRDATEMQVASEERQLDMQPSGDGSYVAYGFAPRIADCCTVAGQSVTIGVRLQDASGNVGMDERTVMAGPCIDRNTGGSQCP